MSYPTPMDIAEAEDREADMIDGQALRLLRLNGLGEYADEIASLRSRLAEATGQLDAANKHVEILQSSAVENYNVWCEQMAALRERLAEASVAEANLHKRLNEWTKHCEGVEARLVKAQKRIESDADLIACLRLQVDDAMVRLAEVEDGRKRWIATAELHYKEEQALEKRLSEIIGYCAQEGNDGEPYDTINAIATGEYSTRGGGR
jgi:chromosome segregation ATPase